MNDLAQTMLEMGRRGRAAAASLALASSADRSRAISAMAKQILANESEILASNARDVDAATRMVDRLELNPDRLAAMAEALEQIAELPDPIGTEIARWQRPNGLDIARVRTPIGVIGMIFEARPNVAADAAAICVRSGNAVILRSGSEALRTVRAILKALVAGIEESGLDGACVQLVPTRDRDAVGLLLNGLDGSVDLIIPRGGKPLVERVSREARVPVLGHLEGICHTYIHRSANLEMAMAIVRNSKMRRVSICGATETLLVDREIASMALPIIAKSLAGCELRGDEEARSIMPMESATAVDWDTEYLAATLSVRVVPGLDEAIEHIARHGTGHTDAIVSEDTVAAEEFMNRVDSAIVMHNASTQFADGGEFGFGAEIGIATGKLHARGPVGPEQLTSYKYLIRGSGQIRP